MKEKTQVFNVFKKFVGLVENQSGCILKTLQFENWKSTLQNNLINFVEILRYIISRLFLTHLSKMTNLRGRIKW